MPRGISRKTKRARDGNRNIVGKKRTDDEILRDRADIARMRLLGMSQAEIADHLSKNRDYTLSQQMISLDIKAVRSSWFKTSIEDYDKLKLIELARLDDEEAIALAAWERSLKPIIRRETGVTPKGEIDKKIFDEYEDGSLAPRDGNPAFLARLESIRQRRCTILGFEAHQRSENINAAIDTLIAAGYIVRLPDENDAQD